MIYRVLTILLILFYVLAICLIGGLNYGEILLFSRTHLAWLVFLIPGAFFLLIMKRKHEQKMEKLWGCPETVRTLAPSIPREKKTLSHASLMGGVLFAILALLGPRMGVSLEKIHRKGVDIIIALDVSKSMDAEDIQPSRLRRAILELEDFLDTVEGDRLGLVAFAGDAFLQCPLTLDTSAVKIFLDVLDTSLIPVPGTDLGRAIEVALKAFPEKEKKYKVLLLLTDGEDHSHRAVDMAKRASQEGVVIYAIGIGSLEGGVIPLKNEAGEVVGYKKDKAGKVVTTHLDEETLQKIALETGGKYYRSTTGHLELEKIYKEIQKMGKKDLGSWEFTHLEDRYQYFLFLALVCFFLSTYLELPRRKT